jgi:hydroxypyruvate isomerase
MPKLAANLTMLFNEVDFLQRFDEAAKAGFKAVEFLFPYDYTVEQLKDKLTSNNLQLVLHNLPAGNWAGGERGIACHPDRVAEFKEGVDKAITYGKGLGVKQINCLAGIKPQGVSDEDARATLVSNLKYAADKLKAEGIQLLIEPINTFDIPGFFLSRTKQALDIIKDTGSDNIFVQYDIYHMQRMEGELTATIKANQSMIKHIQLADNPGRFEPGTGEINYQYLFRMLDEIGYDGWIGCEYKPKAGTAAGLGWRAAHGC